ncbi:MAG: AI-2E family transporter [Phototrophicaceae bacterium]
MSDNPENIDNRHSTAPAWDERTSLFIGIGFAILLVVLGVLFWSIIPFALATSVIAYLMFPITGFVEKHITRGRRGIAIALTFLMIIVLIVLVFVMLLPPLIEQSISSIISLYNGLIQLITTPYTDIPIFRDPETEEIIALTDYISNILREQGFTTVNEWIVSTSRNVNLDRETIMQIFNISGDVTTSIVGSVFTIAGSALGILFSSLFFISILAMLLAGGDSIAKTLVNVAPDGYQDDTKRLLGDLGGVWDGYVRGNFTLGLIMGFAMWLIAIVFGLPNPLFLAFVAFSMEFIPNIGPTISMIAVVAVALISGSSTFAGLNNVTIAGLIVVIWIIMQQLEAIILVPRIVGENLRLHPVIVVMSVIWGAGFGGLVGVIIAPPLVASIRIILQYIYGRLTNRPAFVEHEDAPESPLGFIQDIITWVSERLSGDKKKQAPSVEGNEES